MGQEIPMFVLYGTNKKKIRPNFFSLRGKINFRNLGLNYLIKK
jgi:hypothetical protein